MEKISIEKTGSFFPLDKDGFIINTTSLEKVQEQYRPVLEDVKKEFLSHFGENLHSVYVRGSVAKGEAVEHLSDVDSFAVVKLDSEEDIVPSEAFAAKIKEKYPFITKVEMEVIPLQRLSQFRGDEIMIKTQSICIYGENLADSIAPIRPKEAAFHVRSIAREIRQTETWLEKEHSSEEVAKKCVWIMKRLLRVGSELVMERAGTYTRDLYLCYELFSQYYPEKEKDMRVVLELAINPTPDREEIQSILRSFGAWIDGEVKKVFITLT